MRSRFVLPLLSCLLALSACGPSTLTLYSFDGSATTKVPVEIADSPSEREIGLMNRATLEKGTGMFFVFRDAQILNFWMKNTLIPLEILYFDKDGNFINVAEMIPCAVDPCPQYKSQAQAQYALEVNPGFRKTHNIGVGWRLDLKEVKRMSRPS